MPSLKYRLLPDYADLQPGNAATLYYRAMALLVENRNLREDLRKEHWDAWQRIAPADLPLAEVEAKLLAARTFVGEVEVAARQRQCDWQLDGRAEGIGLNYSEVQGLRLAARVLAVKARYEVAAGKLPQALHTLQTGFALARHLSEGPTLIHVLIGVAVANVMTNQVEAFVQRPGAPNLYWAMTVLPRPFFDPQHALREEATMLERSLPSLKELAKGPATAAGRGGAARSRQVSRHLQYGQADLLPGRPGGCAGHGIGRGPAYLLRPRLHGRPAQGHAGGPAGDPVRVRGLPRNVAGSGQVAHVPHGFEQPAYKQLAARHKQAMVRLDRLFFCGLLNGLSEGAGLGIEKVFETIGRFDRRLAALHCVEAVRLYAAAHGGKPPAALADVADARPPPTR